MRYLFVIERTETEMNGNRNFDRMYTAKLIRDARDRLAGYEAALPTAAPEHRDYLEGTIAHHRQIIAFYQRAAL